MSIRYHLIIRIFVASIILVGSAAWLGFNDVEHETRELFDSNLASSARIVLSFVQAESGEIDFSSIQKNLDQNQLQTGEPDYQAWHDNRTELRHSGHVYENKLGFQVLNDANELLLKSANMPSVPISDNTMGFGISEFSGFSWRVFTLQSKDKKYRSITAERIDVRRDLTGKIFSNLLILFILLVPALSLTSWFVIDIGLSPLRLLAMQINRLGAEKLDSVSEYKSPSEIQTITGALNQLLSRLQKALARERRITSDAAHELRTPMAAVKLHAELAQRATNKRDRNDSINQVLIGIDRSTHLVDQLLTLARLEPETLSGNLSEIALNPIIIDEAAMQAPFAHSKNIDLSLGDGDEITAPVDDMSFRLLVRNLLRNALTYTPDNGTVEISLTRETARVTLTIKDNGPGIPVEDRSRVFERFYRGANHESAGCGIGLSIVMRVVELHHATLTLDQPASGTGLIVSVCFPGTSLPE